jgi:hypothetical protein
MAVYFLWHWLWAHTPQVLPGTLPFGARTFLRTHSSDTATVRPTPLIQDNTNAYTKSLIKPDVSISWAFLRLFQGERQLIQTVLRMMRNGRRQTDGCLQGKLSKQCG